MNQPVFPHTREQIERGEEGMSLRDYFAAHASEHDIQEILGLFDEDTTRQDARFLHADAMLKAREQ